MAAEKYFPFRSVSGDRKYSAEDWAAYFALFLGNGIFYSDADKLKVTAGDGMKVKVGKGAGFINGRMYMLETDKIITLDMGDGVLNRIDRIVIRCDYTNRQISTECIKGSYDETPAAPELTRTANIYELALADIYIGAGTIEITQADITDLRLNTSLCGIVTGLVEQADTEEIYNQFAAYFEEFKEASAGEFDEFTAELETITKNAQADIDDQRDAWEKEFDEWFVEIKGALEGDVAAELTNRVLDLEKNSVTNDQLAGEAIYPTKAGESILLTDASDDELLGMRVCGKTEQISTNGYQLFDASKLATTTLDTATVTNNGDGSFTVSGSGTISKSTAIGFKCTHEETLELIKTAGIYYLNLGNITNPYVRITFRNADGAFAVLSGGNAESTQCEVTEEMLADESFYVYFTFYAASGSAIITGTVKPMLYMYGGGTWEPFTGSKPSPSPEYPQKLETAGDSGSVTAKVLGKNLLRYPYGNQTATINGVTFTVNSNGSVTANGTATADANFVLASGNTDKSLMRKGVTYTYKALTSAGSGSTFYSSFTYGKHKFDYDFGSGRTFTCDEDFDYFYARICVVSGVTVNNVTFKPQLELGSTATAYEPYTSQPLTLSTPNGLPGIQVSDESLANYTDENGQMWCCDEINLTEGYRVQRVNEYVFTGAEAIQSGTSSGVRYYSFGGLLSDAPTPSWSSTQSPGVCTHFTVLHNKTFGGMRDNTLWYSQRDFNSTTGTVAFIMSSVSSKEEATAFLTAEYESGNPVTLRYLLAEPIITPLTADEIAAYKALHTNNPTTTILNDSGAGMEVTYKADEELYQEQSGSPKAEEMYLGKAETAQRAAEDALGNNIHTTYQRKDETENTYAKIDEFIPSMVAGLKTEEAIDAAYDAVHDNATYNSIYRAIMGHEVSHSILGGGRWYLEGYKYMNNNYGWQITRSYGSGGVMFMRTKFSGTWTDWVKLVKSTELTSALAGYLPLDGSKALTGPLKLADEQGLLYCDVEQLYLRLRDVAGNNDNYRAILLRNATSGKNIANSLVLRSVINGGTADYNILHTGNSAPVHTGATAPTDDNAVWFVVE